MSEPAWSLYQEQVAAFFRSLGLEAATNVHVEGARAGHDVDVLVTFRSAGITVTWVVECKRWKRPVGKGSVLTLAGVMGDVGADRGLIVAESGFQAGAIRACVNTNITLTSVEDLNANTEDERARVDTAALAQRIAGLQELTMGLWEWSAPSTPTGGIGFDAMIEFAGDTFELHTITLPAMIAGRYPIALRPGGRTLIEDASQQTTLLEPVLREIDVRARSLQAAAEVAYTRVLADVEGITEAVEELIACGRAIPRGPTPDGGEDTASGATRTETSYGAALSAFLNAMRRVGDIADRLDQTAPDRVRSGLTSLMRYLIDNTYNVTVDESPDWDADRAALRVLARQMHDGLCRAARRAGVGTLDPAAD